MAFTTPEFPGRTFQTMKEFSEAMEEKIAITKLLGTSTVTTTAEELEESPKDVCSAEPSTC